MESNKKHDLALTSSCRIAVSLSLISSRSCSVMATSSSWLCIWFHSSWLQGDKHISWFLLRCARGASGISTTSRACPRTLPGLQLLSYQDKVLEGHILPIWRQRVDNTKKTQPQLPRAKERWSRIMRDGTPCCLPGRGTHAATLLGFPTQGQQTGLKAAKHAGPSSPTALSRCKLCWPPGY